jgi:hypothetical protein
MFPDFDVNKDYLEDGVINVVQDQTNFQKYLLIRLKLYEAYGRFNERLMAGCGMLLKLGTMPMQVDAIYGDINFDFRITLHTGFLMW